jgi:hypothetical protein
LFCVSPLCDHNQPPEGEAEGEGKRRKKFDDEQDRLKEQEAATRAERERMEAVMRTLASIEGAGNVSTNKLGSLVGTDADFIREVRAARSYCHTA